MTYVYQPYPRSLYRRMEGGHVYNGVPCEVLTVDSQEAEQAAKLDGWRNSPEQTSDPLDHDGDGRKGGSLPKVKRKAVKRDARK